MVTKWPKRGMVIQATRKLGALLILIQNFGILEKRQWMQLLTTALSIKRHLDVLYQQMSSTDEPTSLQTRRDDPFAPLAACFL
jgi:hypothetical protein